MPNNLNYIFNDFATSDWETLTSNIDSAIINELETFAWLSADDQEYSKGDLFEKNLDLFVTNENFFLNLKLIKSNDLNNKGWLKSFRVRVVDLLEISDHKRKIFFDDRFVIDQFGSHVDEKLILDYICIPNKYRANLYFYSMPVLEHLNIRTIGIARNRWAAYLHKTNSKIKQLDGGLKKSAILFIMDPPAEVQLEEGKKITYVFSHTKHLLQHLQAFIDRGYIAVIKQKGFDELLVITSISPILKIEKKITSIELDEIYNLVGHCSIYHTDFLQAQYTKRPEVTNILIQPAVHWVENGTFFGLDFLICVQAIAPYIDIVVSQNARMIELSKSLLELGGARIPASNYLEVPICIWRAEGNSVHTRRNIRNHYGYSDEVKVIVNGGGAWSWTDTEKFIEEFLKYCSLNPNTKLRFIQMGLRQKSNLDHEECVTHIAKTLEEYREIANKYVIIEDWDTATELLPSALWGFDYGFSLSKDSVEAFQAHRVRLTEYIQHTIPPIINSYDSLAGELVGCAVMLSEPKEYSTLFSMLEAESENEYNNRKKKIENFIKYLNIKGNSNKIVDCLELNNPTLKFKQIEKVKNSSQDMIKRVCDFGFYDLPKSNFNLVERIGNKGIKRNIVLRIVNRIIRAITPKGLHQKMYRSVTSFLYG